MKQTTLFRVALFLPILAGSVHSLSLQKDVAPLGDGSGSPRRMERAQDGGLLVLMEAPAVLVKLGIDGEKKWTYQEHGEGLARIRSAVSDTNNNVIVCIARFGGPSNVSDMMSSVVRLDSGGHEIARLNSGDANIMGGPFYKAISCARWGDGYLIIAKERKNVTVTDAHGKQFNEWAYPDAVIKLHADFSVEWRKQLDIHAGDLGTTGGVQILPNGNAVIAGFDRISILDGTGKVEAQAPITACLWLRTEHADPRIRLACNEQDRQAGSVITELDSSLKTISKLPLGTKNNGLAVVAQSESGNFSLLGYDANHGPFVSTYTEGGVPIATYHFPSAFPEYASRGSIADCLPIGQKSLAVLRFVDRNSATPIVSWLSTN